MEYEGGVATVPFSTASAALRAAIEANLTVYGASVSLEEASATSRSYLVTFPEDLGDVSPMVGYGSNGVSSVTIIQEVQGSVQVGRADYGSRAPNNVLAANHLGRRNDRVLLFLPGATLNTFHPLTRRTK